MQKLNLNELTPKLQKLILDVEKISDKKIEVKVENESTTNIIDYNQSDYEVNDGIIDIRINNSPEIDYMIAHELFHIKLDFSNYPKLNFDLFSSDENFNQQTRATAVALKDIVDHRIIKNWELSEDFRDANIQKLIDEGTSKLIYAEDVDSDDRQLLLYRIVLMLDGELFIDKFEKAKRTAEKLNSFIGKVDSAVKYHNVIVKLFEEFDRTMNDLGYIDLMHNQVVTLTPIFSERQLRLSVNQIFEIMHVGLVNKKNIQPYILLTKTNLQNSGIITIDGNEENPEFFKKIYQSKLIDFLNMYNIKYLTR